MNRFLCLLAVGLYLCLQCQVNEAHLSQSFIENTVMAAKAKVDAAYRYSRQQSLDRVRRNAHYADVVRLMKQPRGVSRIAVRSADYLATSLQMITESLEKRHKRSINATDLISKENLQALIDLTGCSPRHRIPSCGTTQNLHTYRTASSVCNNRRNTRWGASNTPFLRWLPAEYEDGTSTPRGWTRDQAVNDHILPLVREVSNRILPTPTADVQSDPLYTFLVTIFGQFTDHDLTFTPTSPSIASFSDGINCGKTCTRRDPCFPIDIPENDPRFGSNSEDECIPFTRSAPACGSGNTGFNFGASTVREQINTLTSFLDAGEVYGSDEAKARSLRDLTSDKGLLRVNEIFNDTGRELLPFSSMGTNMCATRARITNTSNAVEVPCFFAGDDRSTENTALAALHTVLLREHNRLARALACLNPQWDGERLYQEARKIVGAYLQVMTFRDFLHHIVGPDYIAKQLSTYPGYDEDVNPGIANVFAVAAFRFAHLMIQPFIFRLDEQYEEHPQYPSELLHKNFFTSWRIIFEGGVDPVMRGLVGRPAKLNTQQHMMTEELTDRLFKFSSRVALDLGSLNMQRGRDHGIPGYNKWRRFCGLSEPQTLEELAEVLNNTDLAQRLLNLYGTPDNIDVWLGGVSEPFVHGGRVGPLFACLISTQFQKIRQGDRLWWENDGVFTEAQKQSLRQTSMARIICDNTGITEVPENPFLYRPRGYGYTQCDNIPHFDLSPWKEGDLDSNESSGSYESPETEAPYTPTPTDNQQNIAFSMRLGSNSPKAGYPIIFHDVIYNGQNSYNTENGIFTCETPGVYEFEFSLTIYQKSASVDLVRNGKRILHSYTTKHSGYLMASGSIYVQLESGDKVWLVAQNSANGITSNSYFNGHLLFEV
ncbi:eosinophil peroxidase-like isoform X3 [Oreochromis aureus]|nr:eosinophil peroxidase-like isoform X3 [Oreochromis aureus]